MTAPRDVYAAICAARDAYCTGESCPFEGDCDNPDVECAIDNAQEDYNAVGWSP